MIKHIVFFKHERFDELKEELVDKLRALKDEITYIKSLEVGVDFLRSERSYDAVISIEFENREDLSRYANDPEHLPVVKWIKSNGFETKVVDYEVFS